MREPRYARGAVSRWNYLLNAETRRTSDRGGVGLRRCSMCGRYRILMPSGTHNGPCLPVWKLTRAWLKANG